MLTIAQLRDLAVVRVRDAREAIAEAKGKIKPFVNATKSRNE